jgi:hypothetical protein
MDTSREGMLMERKRQGCLSILLVLGIIGSTLGMLAGLGVALWVIVNFSTTHSAALVLPEELAPLAPFVALGIASMVIGGVLSMGQLVAMLAIWNWKKWGLYLLGVVALCSVLQNIWSSTQFGQSGGSSVWGIFITFLAFGLVALFVLTRWKLYE